MRNIRHAPVVIGGLGGSGTRVVARIVRRAGYFMGTNVTGAEDAVEFWEFYDRWINRYLFCREVPLSAEEHKLMELDWSGFESRHRLVIPSENSLWGWKNPRSILLLPFLHRRYPEMKFIHVLRDGRDMAFSSTAQEQVKRHGPAILRSALTDAPLAVRTAACWAKINFDAASYGEVHMPGQYLVVVFEKLCVESRRVIDEIFDFLGVGAIDAAQIARELVTHPDTVGRWHGCADMNMLKDVQTHAAKALEKFGYG